MLFETQLHTSNHFIFIEFIFTARFQYSASMLSIFTNTPIIRPGSALNHSFLRPRAHNNYYFGPTSIFVCIYAAKSAYYNNTSTARFHTVDACWATSYYIYVWRYTCILFHFFLKFSFDNIKDQMIPITKCLHYATMTCSKKWNKFSHISSYYVLTFYLLADFIVLWLTCLRK